MRLLLDECVPRPFKKEFVGHDVKTAREAGLAGLKNGQLLRAAEGEFDALITVDKSIPYQQNVKALQPKHRQTGYGLSRHAQSQA